MTQSGRKLNVAIIGAGISGLSAAWELSQAGAHVDVYERDSTPGGLAGWFDIGGVTLEKFYHHIYNKDTDLIGLIDELGLGKNLVFKSTSTGCFYVNRIYRLSSPMDLLRYSPLPFPDRIRLGLMAVRARFVKDWHRLDSLSAKDWIVGMAGRNVYDIVWEPLFRSKFGRYADEVSAAWLWSKLVQRGGSRGKTGGEELGYFKGGYGVLFKELERQLMARSVRFHYGQPVEAIEIHDGSARAVKAGSQTHEYDAVLATAQVPDFIGTLPPETDSYRKDLGRIGFLGNACLVMELNHRLSDTYWLNITDSTCPFVGVIEQTNLLGEENYRNRHLAYISRYMDTDDPLYSLTANDLFETYLPYLQKIFPAFRRDWVINLYLWHESHAQAIVSINYHEKIPASRTPIRKLYLSTMAQVFPEDRQMSNGVKLARAAARQILEDAST